MAEQNQIELKTIPITQVEFGERFRIAYGDIKTLTESIIREGIIQPLAVKQTGEDTYTLLAGGRRFKACQEAKIEKIPVRVYPSTISDLEMRSIELMENVCRLDLDWLEGINLKNEIHKLQTQIHGRKVSTAPGAVGWSERNTAELLGESNTSVSNDINLAEATEVFPQIKEAKNKTEAFKMLKALQEGIVKEEIARRLQERVGTSSLDKVHMDLSNKYVVGDFFEKIHEVPDGVIDLVEMDPPYAINLKQVKKTNQATDPLLYIKYNEIDEDEYINFMDRVLGEVYRVMSENSWLIMWFGIDPWFEHMYGLLTKHSFKTRRLHALWYKPGTGQTMQPNKYLATSYECFFYAAKGNPVINKQGRSNVFYYKPVPAQLKTHPTERPIELIEDILSTFAWENARILVPFLGSGNTLLAAANLSMQAFGYDLADTYKDSYILKVHSSVPGKYKSTGEEQKDAI